MQYEFRAKTLRGAIRASLAPQPVSLRRKSSVSIDSGARDYKWEDVEVTVSKGSRYTISWEAKHDAGDGGAYAIKIKSYDGHGSYTGSFTRSGRWTFNAKTTGTIKFAIGFYRTFGAVWSSYPIEVDVN